MNKENKGRSGARVALGGKSARIGTLYPAVSGEMFAETVVRISSTSRVPFEMVEDARTRSLQRRRTPDTDFRRICEMRQELTCFVVVYFVLPTVLRVPFQKDKG